MAETVERKRQRELLWDEWTKLEATYSTICEHGRSIIQNHIEIDNSMVVTYLSRMRDLRNKHKMEIVDLLRKTAEFLIDGMDK